MLRAVLNGERIDYWLGVGAEPSEKVRVLIKKYGSQGTHLEQQQAALEQLKANKPTAPPPMVVPRPKKAELESAEQEAATEGQEGAGSENAEAAPPESGE